MTGSVILNVAPLLVVLRSSSIKPPQAIIICRVRYKPRPFSLLGSLLLNSSILIDCMSG